MLLSIFSTQPLACIVYQSEISVFFPLFQKEKRKSTTTKVRYHKSQKSRK